MTDTHGYVETKAEFLKKEWESAGEDYARHWSQINSIRGWTTTLLMGYFGFAVTLDLFSDLASLVPALFVIAAFFLVELFERLDMTSIRKEAYCIEDLLMIQDASEREKQIREYRFARWERRPARTHLRNLPSALASARMILWYLFLIISFSLMYVVFGALS